MSATLTNIENDYEYSIGLRNEGNLAVFTDQLVYEVVKLSDCEYDPESETFYYLCPCGDVFEITLDDLLNGNLLSECPSCSLRIRIDIKPGELDEYIRLRNI